MGRIVAFTVLLSLAAPTACGIPLDEFVPRNLVTLEGEHGQRVSVATILSIDHQSVAWGRVSSGRVRNFEHCIAASHGLSSCLANAGEHLAGATDVVLAVTATIPMELIEGELVGSIPAHQRLGYLARTSGGIRLVRTYEPPPRPDCMTPTRFDEPCHLLEIVSLDGNDFVHVFETDQRSVDCPFVFNSAGPPERHLGCDLWAGRENLVKKHRDIGWCKKANVIVSPSLTAGDLVQTLFRAYDIVPPDVTVRYGYYTGVHQVADCASSFIETPWRGYSIASGQPSLNGQPPPSARFRLRSGREPTAESGGMR